VSRIRSMGKVTSDSYGEAIEPMPLEIDVVTRLGLIDEDRLIKDRLNRLRSELAKADVVGALLADPMNIRYATGTRNMSVWTLHAPGRYVYVPTDGPITLFEFGQSRHVSAKSPVVSSQVTSTPWFYFLCGPRVDEKARIWADEVITVIRSSGGGNGRLAIDRCEPWGAEHLVAGGFTLVDAQGILERARAIKTPEEIKCLQLSMDVCDVAVNRLRAALRPGITENQLLECFA